jgi:hypothetical protein
MTGRAPAAGLVRRAAVAIAAPAAGLVLACGLLAPARAQVAADDPRLIERMETICRAAALAQGGIDAGTAALCRCTAPVLAAHLTPEARTSFVERNRAPDGPVYDDEQAVLAALLAACPQAKSP